MEPLTTTSSNVLTQGTSARASGTPASGIATSVVTSVAITITIPRRPAPLEVCQEGPLVEL